MKSNKLIAYAMDFASYFVQNIEDAADLDKIRNIFLFGSVARGDQTDKSDVDIFIDTEDRSIEKKADKILIDFYKSIKYVKYWQLLDVKNEISLKIGDLSKWELKDSIQSSGILLYGKYLSSTDTKPFMMFELKIKGKRKMKIKVWRKLYGYTQKVNRKAYENKGMINEAGGKKIGKATFMVPVEHSSEIIKYLKSNKLSFTNYIIWSKEFSSSI